MARRSNLMDDPFVQFLAGLGAAAIAGYAAKKIHDGLTAQEKKQWREQFPVHHGEVGVPIVLGGIMSGNPTIAGAGLGLVLSDIDDKNEWFRKRH